MMQLQNKTEGLEEFRDKLKEVLSYYHSDKYHISTCLCYSTSVISCEKQTGLIWKDNETDLIACQLSHELTPVLSFNKVRVILIFSF